MTSARFRLLPVEATEAMRDAASAAVIAEWQAMIAEHRGAADVARSFVSPSNYRLVLAAINAALSAAPVMAEATNEMIRAAMTAWDADEQLGLVTLRMEAALNAALAIAAGQLGEKESGE